ncbi:TIGR02569 family protein [Nonomuraea angiospora]|uniref:TIGR02569 family protein n=1 Tax=Nonomuraea angiospora TaxID=46172 RepID=UPI0029B237F6|nr:TIGR02569 family protein [Nonomuraea angiospora]MDX3100548.1 TIGR02569 family protein [Nonomuraea angiospora]
MTLGTMTEPPAGVLAAFGLAAPVRPLAGGRGRSFRAGDAVVKPVDSAEEADWSARVLADLPNAAGFRVPRPLRSRDGAYVVEGWSAAEFLEGREGPAGKWGALIAAGRAFHRALRHVPRPPLIDRRDDPWAAADRVAWGEAPLPRSANADELLGRLGGLAGPVTAPSQLIHGDLTGNVLFHLGQPPVVIDFSPYWRPVAYAEAVVVADGLLYHQAEPELIETVLPGREGLHLLARALIFRLATAAIWEGRVPEEELTRFAAVTHLVEERGGLSW